MSAGRRGPRSSEGGRAEQFLAESVKRYRPRLALDVLGTKLAAEGIGHGLRVQAAHGGATLAEAFHGRFGGRDTLGHGALLKPGRTGECGKKRSSNSKATSPWLVSRPIRCSNARRRDSL